MSMLDSFFNKGFKAAKCKTLLKLTIPRIKLLRNRREIQIKQMRRDIAKLLETGQEATARIRVEHIIREEKMMAAQEIIELFCELITVRLPIIEAQRECPLDLKEAISSVCFAAPRCSDLTELLQVQMLFAAKYGKEFVSAATELMPECGVNRQLIELLSVRAPAPDVKLKLLKEIAEEHELDWDPAASETELLKPHEDLLNGPTQFVSGSTLPLPKEKHDESLYSASGQAPSEPSDTEAGFDPSDFPEVPNAALQPSAGTVSAPQMLPFPASALSDSDDEPENPYGGNENQSHNLHLEPEGMSREELLTKECENPNVSVGEVKDKQFLPFISPPSLSSASFSVRQDNPPPPISRTRSEARTDFNVDLQDVLAAAQAAAESAERAATAARSAASLAQVRISELVKKQNDEASNGGRENPFHADKPRLDNQNSLGDSDVSDSPSSREDHGHHPGRQTSNIPSYDDPKMEVDSSLNSNPFHADKPRLDNQNSLGDSDVSDSPSPCEDHGHHPGRQPSNIPSYDDPKMEVDSSLNSNHVLGQDTARHQPQRLTSMDDDPYFSYPNLFTSQGSNPVSRVHSFADNSNSPSER